MEVNEITTKSCIAYRIGNRSSRRNPNAYSIHGVFQRDALTEAHQRDPAR